MRLIELLLYWLGYFALHSALASNRVKLAIRSAWPKATAYYRLAYNCIAVLLLLPAIWLLYFQDWPVLYRFDGLARLIAVSVKLLALAGFFYSLKFYDLQEFLGLQQARGGDRPASFVVSPLHRHVRHPWYFFGLLILWSSDLDAGRLLTNLAVTWYFIVGSRLEERKLVEAFGGVYVDYMRKVPGLVPLPWKYLKKNETLLD